MENMACSLIAEVDETKEAVVILVLLKKSI